ncbi:N-acetylmuramic acid 6-phosphate etherase [Myroides sp. LJL116]
MGFTKTTEQASLYDNLQDMTPEQILYSINKEDQSVALSVEKAMDQILKVVQEVTKKLKHDGRLFYIGAGTSGRLGILDASECPPTFGVDHNCVIGLIAGGDKAIRTAVENAEDNIHQGFKDLQEYNINQKDIVLGIAASGTTPYVLGALESCKQNGILTAGLTCNANSPLAQLADLPIEVVVGPEFLSGSSRMKAGTAQKMVLNMITTSVMIGLGKVHGNKMVDMKMTNEKLIQRGAQMLVEQLQIDHQSAVELLEKYKSVRKVLDNYKF